MILQATLCTLALIVKYCNVSKTVKQMLERTKHLKELHDGSQLSPITKPTKTVSYQLLKINVEIEQVAIFVDLQQCCIDVVPLEIYEKKWPP